MTPRHHPDDLREVAGKAAERCILVALALQSVTAPLMVGTNPKERK